MEMIPYDNFIKIRINPGLYMQGRCETGMKVTVQYNAESFFSVHSIAVVKLITRVVCDIISHQRFNCNCFF